MNDRIHKFITSEKEICLRRLEEQFKNYTENELYGVMEKIVEKRAKLSIKEKAVLSLPRGDGNLKINQDEILEKYADLIFPKYEQEFRKWCQKIIQETEKDIEKRIFTTLPILISIPDLEEKVRQRCMEIIIIYSMVLPEQICRVSNFESLYKAFHFHILSRMDLSTAFNLYCPEMTGHVFAVQMLLSQEIDNAFDKLEKILIEIIDEQKPCDTKV